MKPKLTIDRRLVINFFYAIILYFMFSTAISTLSNVITFTGIGSNLSFRGAELIIYTAFFLGLAVGIAMMVIPLFSNVIPYNVWFIATIICLSILFAMFILSFIITKYTFPRASLLQQCIFLATVFGINLYVNHINNRNYERFNDIQ